LGLIFYQQYTFYPEGEFFMDIEKKQGITRRSFLKNSAAGAGAIAVTSSGLLAAEKAVAQPASSSSASSVEAAKYPWQKAYSWETPPAAIPDSKIKEKITTDILVIGCGVSGATAALSANETGVKVIVLEKYAHYNCRGSDNAAIDSKVQKKLGIKIDKDEVCLALEKYFGNRSDQRLLRLWANNSGRIIDWLADITEPEKIMLKMKKYPYYPEGYDAAKEWNRDFQVAHWFTGRQPGLMATLEKVALKRGVDIRYNTRAVQLIRKDKGRVSGVIAQDKDGNYVQYNASKGVILCTGDYGHDEEMMEAYCKPCADIAKTVNPYDPPVNTGDGHKMAMWIGGVMEPGPHAAVDHSSGGPMGACAFLHVNTLGERYENEDVTSQMISNSMKRQPGKVFWQIYDSKWEDEVGKMGVGLLMYGDESGKSPGDSEGAYLIKTPEPPAGKKVQANNIEDLARKMEIPVDTFKATVARYNELCKGGKDLDFGKRSDRMTTVDKPPYYAGQAVIAFLVSLGGLYVNTKLQLLDQDRKPIEGIYMAGNTVGNRTANDYTTMCPGMTHAFAWTTGYLAAKSALGVKDPAFEPTKA
jgi:fumarate reductase flavoprotein subunit